MDRDPDTAAKGQGVLFQILSVARKLSASENRTEKKVGGGGRPSRSNTHKSTEERKNQQEAVTRIQCKSWTSGPLSEVRVGPQVYQDLFLIIKRKPGGLSNKFYRSVL